MMTHGLTDADDDPEESFARIIALRRLAADLERTAVDAALDQGWTWAQIGQALGITGQAAHKRLAPSNRSPFTRGATHENS